MGQIGDIIQAYKNVVTGTNKELADARMKICKPCIFYISLTSQCLRCGCPMIAKSTLKKKQCPLGKW